MEFSLPTLFVLLGLKFDSGLGYRDFVAYVNFNPFLLNRLGIDRTPHFSLLQKAVTRLDSQLIIDRTPHFSLLQKAVTRLDSQLIHRMQELLARKRPPPKNIAVDSSGFSHSTGGEWMNLRFKKTLKRRFHALHNAVDTDTLMVNASCIRARPGGDARHMIALVRRVATSELETVYGDKAYISRKNVQYITDLGAYPAIEPKKRLKAQSRGYRGYKELIREYRRDPEEWKKKHSYGKRSLVESVFGMMKVRFGGGLRSRAHR
ncbi:MAG: transposase, partial [Candidatus Thorarchaeota archaeon]